jgi:hypothetical protein
MNWSHQPSMVKEQNDQKEIVNTKEFLIENITIGNEKNEHEENEVNQANNQDFKEKILGKNINIKMFENEETQNILRTKNKGDNSVNKRVIFKNEFTEINDDVSSESNEVDVENEVNKELKKDNEFMNYVKKGRNFRETMGNIYSCLEKTFDNLSIEESPRESLNQSNHFYEKTNQLMAQSDINNYIVKDTEPKSQLIKTTRSEIIYNSSHKNSKSDQGKLFYNRDTYNAKIQMRSPDLMKYMGKNKKSNYFIKKDKIHQEKKQDLSNNSFINMEEEQTTIEKNKNKFSAVEIIHSFSRTPKTFKKTQKLSQMHKRFSPKIKSSKILPNLPKPQKEKMTQSFYEIPIHQQNSMIIDRSYDWGYRPNHLPPHQVNYFPPNHQIYPVYSQRNLPYKMNGYHPYHQHYYDRAYQGRQEINEESNQIGMRDVTNNYAKMNRMGVNNEVRDNHIQKQFVHLESQPLNRSNNVNFVGGFNGINQQFSLEDLELNLMNLFKKILVFSSKIDSLKVKILKRNPEFSVISIFQTFCDLSTRRIDLQGIKEFTQTFGFDFSFYFLIRVFVYLSGYRIKKYSIGTHSNALLLTFEK